MEDLILELLSYQKALMICYMFALISVVMIGLKSYQKYRNRKSDDLLKKLPDPAILAFQGSAAIIFLYALLSAGVMWSIHSSTRNPKDVLARYQSTFTRSSEGQYTLVMTPLNKLSFVASTKKFNVKKESDKYIIESPKKEITLSNEEFETVITSSHSKFDRSL